MRNQKIQQIIKWSVYSLLIVNFLFYIAEDWGRARHTITAVSTFLDWTSEFATSIDELGWFLLLFMFELETYVIEVVVWLLILLFIETIVQMQNRGITGGPLITT